MSQLTNRSYKKNTEVGHKVTCRDVMANTKVAGAVVVTVEAMG